MHYHKTIFGDDADQFVPERWLRDGEAGAANMERHWMSFGYGSRTCVGKHIAIAEMLKWLPALLRDFEFELMVDEWTVWHGFFAMQKDVMVRAVRKRDREGRGRPVLVGEGKY